MRRIMFLLVTILFIGAQAFAQTTISGTVSDGNGDPVPGATVRVKGFADVGTITDISGKYSLNVPAEATTLVFTFVGMSTIEVEIGGNTTVNATLENEDVGIDEVVVTGFGIKREKREITYQTELIDKDQIMAGQAPDVATSLTGKAAGLLVNNQDNGVKKNTQIISRGLKSITSSNEVLIVIDGAIANSGALADMNPNDIENLNILKGASAAALYGSGAANGALIVTTKKGSNRKGFVIGYNNATTFESVAYMPDFQTEHGTGWDGEYNNIENTNWGPRFDGQVRQIGPTFADGTYQAVPYAPVKDNLKDFYNTGVTIQNTAYLSGGNETGSFYLSIGNQDISGIVPQDKYKKYMFRVNASKKLGKVELNVNSSFQTDEKDVVGETIGDQDRPLYWFVLNTPANIPLSSYSNWSDPTPGNYGYSDYYYNAFYQNPYWAVGTNRNIDKTNRLNASMSASWDITDRINLTGRMGVNNSYGNGKNWRAAQNYNTDLQPYHSPVSSFAEDFEFKSTRYTADVLLSGNFNLADDFTLKAIVGASTYSYKYRESTVTANNLSIPDFYDISNGTGSLLTNVDELQKRTVGVFADLTFGFRNWAFLNLTGREDFTSTLKPENRSYFYPQVGLSVLLSEALPVIVDNGIVSMVKLTASNSTVYNDLDPYRINEVYTQNITVVTNNMDFPFPYGDINGFEKTRTTIDPNIKKEKINTTEFGANLGFLQDRFTIDATYYFFKTTDLITSTTPSVASGATRMLTNIGGLKGSGIEITVGGKILKIGDFSWDLRFNFFQQETIVDEIAGDLKEVAVEAWNAGYGTYAIVGEAFPQIKAVEYVRDPQGRVVVDATSGNPIVGQQRKFGRSVPLNTYGLTTQLNYKGITLSATLDYRTDFVYYAQGADNMEFTGRSLESVSSNRNDFVWPNSVIQTSPGVYVENTNVPITGGRMLFWQNTYNQIKENYVKDATAFKIRELSLNYNLPKSILSKTKVVSKVTLGFVARNVLTVLPKGQHKFSDPEFRNNRQDFADAANGIGIGGYFTSPPTRSFGFNVNVEF